MASFSLVKCSASVWSSMWTLLTTCQGLWNDEIWSKFKLLCAILRWWLQKRRFLQPQWWQGGKMVSQNHMLRAEHHSGKLFKLFSPEPSSSLCLLRAAVCHAAWSSDHRQILQVWWPLSCNHLTPVCCSTHGPLVWAQAPLVSETEWEKRPCLTTPTTDQSGGGEKLANQPLQWWNLTQFISKLTGVG